MASYNLQVLFDRPYDVTYSFRALSNDRYPIWLVGRVTVTQVAMPYKGHYTLFPLGVFILHHIQNLTEVKTEKRHTDWLSGFCYPSEVVSVFYW